MAKPAETASRGPNNALAFALVLPITLTIPFSLLSFNLYRVFFSPLRVKALITDEAINSDMAAVAPEWFSDRQAMDQTEEGVPLGNLAEPNIALLIPYIDRSAWRTISHGLLTEDFVTGAISVTIDGVYPWIEGDDPAPRIVLDLEPLRNRARGDHGLKAFVVAFDRLPDCTPDQVNDVLNQISAGPPRSEVLFDFCKLPDPLFEEQITDFVGAFREIIDEISQEFALGKELFEVAEEAGADLAVLKQISRQLRLAGRLAWIPPPILMLLIAALFFRVPWSLALWIGVPLIVGGFLSMLFALSNHWLIGNVLAAGALSETPDAIRPLAIRLIERSAGEAFGSMAIQAAVIMALGLGLAGLYTVHVRRANFNHRSSQP